MKTKTKLKAGPYYNKIAFTYRFTIDGGEFK